MSFLTDTDLKNAYVKQLEKVGRSASVDVSVGEGGTRFDILSDREVVLCALELTSQSALAIRSQFTFYRNLLRSWKKVAAVQRIVDVEAAEQLIAAGIEVVIVSVSNTELYLGGRPTAQGSSLVKSKFTQSKSAQSKFAQSKFAQSSLVQSSFVQRDDAIYQYPALDSVRGGDGWRAGVLAISVVLIIGIVGLGLSSQKSPERSSYRQAFYRQPFDSQSPLLAILSAYE